MRIQPYLWTKLHAILEDLVVDTRRHDKYALRRLGLSPIFNRILYTLSLVRQSTLAETIAPLPTLGCMAAIL